MTAPYYQDEHVTLYHGDCRDVLPMLRDVACVVTSPPYNTLGNRIPSTPTGGFGRARLGGWVKNVNQHGYADDMTEDEYGAWQRDVARLLADASRPGASFFYNHKVRYRDGVPVHPIDLIRRFPGWTLRQELIWSRPGAIAFNARMFAPSDERIYWLVRDRGHYHWNQPSAAQMTVWRIAPPMDPLGDAHPCPFPREIPQRGIEATTMPGDVVLDPFCGSGTTLDAARLTDRRAIGIEIEERFCDAAAKRFAQGVFNFEASHMTA